MRWQPWAPRLQPWAHPACNPGHPACNPTSTCVQVLISLLEMAPSHEDAQALKGFACLRELRRAAVQEEEAVQANAPTSEAESEEEQ